MTSGSLDALLCGIAHAANETNQNRNHSEKAFCIIVIFGLEIKKETLNMENFLS